jgi:ABC-type antimicrobial peptide transport system permease subunit
MSVGAGGPLDIEIVGVMADMNALSLREAAKPTYFIPYEQAGSSLPHARSAGFFVRAGAGFDSLPNAVRATVAQMDSALPVYAMRSMEVRVADSVYTDRLIAALSAVFGVLALVLTAVGLYGVIAYVVSRRGAEIGIRMALGAARRDIVWLVMREVSLLTAAGAAIGLAGAVAAGRAVESQLFGVRGLDPTILVAVPLTLAAVALSASCMPALRASRTDPMEALRHE